MKLLALRCALLCGGLPLLHGLSVPNPPAATAVSVSPIISTGVDMKAFAAGFTTCPTELDPTIIPIDLPPDFPIGTHYRNGHARFEADDGTKVLHPFDADGMIVAMTFDPANGRMLFRNKFVETEGYVNDRKTGTMTERGLFGTLKSGGFVSNAVRMGYKHVGNTNVIYSGGDLYALWEGGKPYRLDPLTLGNRGGEGKAGMSDLGGLIDENFSAHPRYSPESKSYVNFGSIFDPIKSQFKVSLYEVDEESFTSRHATIPNFVLAAPALLHDFVLTKNYCIFNINDTRINTLSAIKAMLGSGGFAGSLEVNEDVDHSNIVLIPRSLFDEPQSSVDGIDLFDDDRIIVVPVPQHFNFHYANAFEDSDGNVVFDTVQIDGMELATDTTDNEPIWTKENLYENISPSRLMRYVIDVENKCLAVGRPNPTLLTSRLPEFPSIPKDMSTREHRYAYPVVARKKVDVDPKTGQGGPPGGIAKIDVLNPSNNEYYSLEPHEFPGECVLCPKSGRNVAREEEEEDACYLLVNIMNGRDLTTELAVFDVEGKGSLERGPVVRCPLPVFVPHMLHGSFAEGVTFDFESYES